MKTRLGIICATIALLISFTIAPAFADDPLPSWNDGKTKSSIIHFVDEVTNEKSSSFVPVEERIATFDNDGTLWLEMPLYIQLLFGADRVKTIAPQHPEWKNTEPFESIIAGNIKAAFEGGDKSLLEVMLSSTAGMTIEELVQTSKQWLATAEDTRFKRHYTQLVYQPMLELLSYLRSNGFKTYIVSGGGTEFVRSFSEKTYGIPPEQVVGSSTKTKFEDRNGHPAIVELPEIEFITDKTGKPLSIQRFIGRRPLAAFGNSDGDLDMLQWTAAKPGPHFCLYVHHTDDVREYAYDRNSKIGRLDKGLDAAAQQGWTVVDMKNDWKTIFPPI